VKRSGNLRKNNRAEQVAIAGPGTIAAARCRIHPQQSHGKPDMHADSLIDVISPDMREALVLRMDDSGTMLQRSSFQRAIRVDFAAFMELCSVRRTRPITTSSRVVVPLEHHTGIDVHVVVQNWNSARESFSP
jgi:hypothetical protein